MKVFRFWRKGRKQDPHQIEDLEEDEEQSISQETAKQCPILYPRHGAGWACGKGWHEILQKMSFKIEELHQRYYKKYRIRVEATDIKEKWGELRIDLAARVDQHPLIRSAISLLVWTNELLQKVNYKMEVVVDCPSYVEHVEKELSKVEFIKEKYRTKNCDNATCIERDGKYFYVADYEQYRQTHQEPTRLKFLCRFKNWCHVAANALEWREQKISSKQRMLLGYVNAMIEQFIREAEDEASRTCERCGQRIGEDWSPTCETSGWITRLCTCCAEKQNSEYYKNGELWLHDKLLKTAEELKKERSEVEIKMCDESSFEEDERKYEEELKAAEEEEARMKEHDLS